LVVPREPRVYIEKVLYFITARVNNDRTLFHDEQDYAEYLKPLSEFKLLNGFKLFAYALMPQQICLVIELRNNVTISTVMHNLNSRYTKIYNSRYGTKGHLFQGRFKSVLVEKEEYLLRLTRYVHMLPGHVKAAEDAKQYSYSSYPIFISTNSKAYNVLEKPDMESEVQEVLGHLGKNGTTEELKNVYQGYVNAADKNEIKEVSKLLHRTAFVGSKDFISTIKKKIEEHIKEEKKVKVIHKSNPAFIISGSLIALFLGVVSVNFYNNQTRLQNTLNVTTSGFEVARKDLAERVDKLQGELFGLEKEITGFEKVENHGLGDFAWKLQFRPVQEEKTDETYFDDLQFKGGKIISAKLLAKGFAPFDYTLSRKSHGKLVWQTAQTNAEGLTVRWYGIVSGKNMRGVLSEHPAQGKGRDFSFVNINNSQIYFMEGRKNEIDR